MTANKPWETPQSLAHTENYSQGERFNYNIALQLAAARALYEAMLKDANLYYDSGRDWREAWWLVREEYRKLLWPEGRKADAK
jgi:hypothetical protein